MATVTRSLRTPFPMDVLLSANELGPRLAPPDAALSLRRCNGQSGSHAARTHSPVHRVVSDRCFGRGADVGRRSRDGMVALTRGKRATFGLFVPPDYSASS